MYLFEGPSRDALRVPVRRTKVELHLANEERAAVIFLPPDCSPQDVFEDGTPFFPAEHAGRIFLHARAAIVRLVVEAEVEALGSEHDGCSIAVHLRDGKSVAGGLRSVSGLPRTVDILNQPAKSFAIHAGGKVHHIAKAHVERVEEIR